MTTIEPPAGAGVGRVFAPASPVRLKWDALQVALAAVLFMLVWRAQSLFPDIAFRGLPTLAMLVALLVYVLDRDPRRRLSGLNQPIVLAVLGILAFMALSVPGSLYPRLSLEFLLKGYLHSVILMLLIAATVRGLADLRRLAWLQVAGVVLYSAVIVARSEIASDGELRAMAYYDGNDLAMLIVATLPLAVYLWRRPSGLLRQLLLVAATVFLLMTLAKTGSRGGFVALLAVAAYLLLRFHAISWAKRVGVVALLATLLVALASDAYFAQIQTILHPSADYNWSGRSETGRMEIWKRGLGYMVSHPVVGVGVAMFPKAEGTLSREARERMRYGKQFKWSAPHNSFIQIGAEIGVPGLILFIAVLGGAFRILGGVGRTPVAEATALAQMLTGCLVGFVVGAFFLSHAYSAYLYMLLGMIVGLARIARPVRVRAQSARPGFGRSFAGPHRGTTNFPIPDELSGGAR